MSDPGSPPPPAPVRRVFGNLGFLLRGRALAAVLMLGATAIMTRALGPTGFGVVMLIRSYLLLMRGVFNSRATDSVVRSGVPLHEAGDLAALRRLLRVCHRVDRLFAAVATAVAVALAPFVGPLMGIGHDHVVLLAASSLALLATGNSTADGILRVFDQFDAIGWQITIDGAISLVGMAIAWWLGAPLWVFVAIMAVSYGVRELYLSWRGWREYHRRIGRAPAGESPRDARIAEFPGLLRFMWVAYWQSIMDIVPKHLAVVLAGALLGSAGAGLVRLSRQVSGVVSKLAVLTRQVVFPDLTRSWHRNAAAFGLVTYRTALYAGVFGLVLTAAIHFGGATLLATLFGRKFAVAAALLTLMMLAATFDLVAAPLRSAAYAIERAGMVLAAYAVATVIYLVLFVVLTPRLDLVGIGVASCVAAALPLLVMVVLLRRGTRRAA